MVSGCPKLLGTMTFGEDWGAAKGDATKSTRPIAKPAESCACMASAPAGSVEQVEALDEASSIEPAQRNKTITRALAYGGMRDSVIA